jgi:hypothetical protein
MVKTGLLVGWLLCMLPNSICAQGEKDLWRRVYTGEESLIEVNVPSLTLDVGYILRVRFRTVLSKPETLKEKPETKYKSRLETVEFKLTEKRYRFQEIVLLDSAGKTVQAYEANAAEEWRVLKYGGMMQRLFDAARQLPPFGNWKVVDYRFGDGASIDEPEFRKILGTRVRLNTDRAEVGMKVCSLPAYQSKPFTDKEFSRELGISMLSIGIKENHADTIIVKCEANDWAPPQRLLVQLPEASMLLLWQGVFLVLKKERY